MLGRGRDDEEEDDERKKQQELDEYYASEGRDKEDYPPENLPDGDDEE